MDTGIIPGEPNPGDAIGDHAELHGSINLTLALDNNVNGGRNNSFVYLSPEQYFFASPDVLYVADSGQPKNGNARIESREVEPRSAKAGSRNGTSSTEPGQRRFNRATSTLACS